MICEHPSNQVTADILEGDWEFHSVQWCRICGAFRLRSELIGHVNFSPWTVPRGQMKWKSVRCHKCGNYVPGHATGAGDICTCEPIATSTPCSHETVLYNEEADNFYCQDCKQGMGEEYYHLHKTWQNEPQ